MRRGRNFVLRLTPDERTELESMCTKTAGPTALGPWLVWAAKLAFNPPLVLPRRRKTSALPARASGAAMPAQRRGMALPLRSKSSGNAGPGARDGNADDIAGDGNASKVILDLCAGTGAWSDPYRLAGYTVLRWTLPDFDVHTERIRPERIHGILCAPPCTEFSLAKNGHKRDIRAGLETVSACLRFVVACRPVWWALENPVGLLSHYLGTPRDVWEPYEFGDPHTKATAVWGDFVIPERGPFVQPTGSALDRPTAEERAITPDGFANAFFDANP